ncbi:ubiquitin-conjugating enzyme E2-17 kDa-like [Cochliomyia hominivorax]
MNNSKIKNMRIPVELQQLQKSQKDHGIKCSTLPSKPDDYSCLEAFIPGPKGSPYEEGIFKLNINFGEQYPFRPPTIKFVTPVYHPNIDNSGKICLDLLRMPPTGSYNPAITLESILLSIQLLLANPNPDDPLQGCAADLFKSNRELFNEKAKKLVKNHSLNENTDANTNSKETDEMKTKDEANKKKLKLSYK